MVQRLLSVSLGLLVLTCLKLLGDAFSGWLEVRVPGSFLGFLALFVVLALVRHAPRVLTESSAFLLNHLTLFLLPSLVAAAAGLGFVSHAAGLLLVSGSVVTVLMAVVCALVLSARQRPSGGGHDD